MTSEEMKEELSEYLDHIRLANDRYVALTSLYKSIECYNKEINYAPGFFTIAIYALADSCCSELAKLYCGSDKEKTLSKLFNIILANIHVFKKKVVTEYRDADNPSKVFMTEEYNVNIKLEVTNAIIKKNNMKCVIDKLKSRRDKYLAHNDKEYFKLAMIAERLPISLVEIQHLISFAGDFCNTMQGYLDGHIVTYNTIGADDLPKLFQIMYEHGI